MIRQKTHRYREPTGGYWWGEGLRRREILYKIKKYKLQVYIHLIRIDSHVLLFMAE